MLAVAQGLLDRGATAGHGVTVLVPNGIDHALVARLLADADDGVIAIR